MEALSQSLLGQKVYIDVNVFIYLLEGVEPWADSVQKIFLSLETGNWHAVTSELSLAESLVKPFQLGREDLAQLYRTALSPRNHFSLAPVDASTLISAARLRAQYSFKLPDAIHVATALAQGCTAFLTNDAGFRRASGLHCMLLSDWVDKQQLLPALFKQAPKPLPTIKNSLSS